LNLRHSGLCVSPGRAVWLALLCGRALQPEALPG